MDKINDILPRLTLVADGTLSEITPTFPLLSEDFVLVYLGEQETSDFTVSLQDNKITLTTPPANGTNITVIRALPIDYTVTLKDRGAINSTSWDELFVEMTAKLQTLKEELSRAPKAPIYSGLSGDEYSNIFFDSFNKAMDILEASKDTLALVEKASTDGLNAINEAQTEAVTEIESKATAASTQIETKAEDGVKAIEDAQEAALAEINEKVGPAIEEAVNSANSAAQTAQTAQTAAETAAETAQEYVNQVLYGHVGDVITTTRTTPPDGCVWCDGGIYTKADHPEVYEKLLNGEITSVTMGEYGQAIQNYGSCAFPTYNTLDETFRVPALNGVYIRTGQADGIELFAEQSLPNITAGARLAGFTTGAFKEGSVVVSAQNASSGVAFVDATFNASRSSSVYQDGADVHPDHVTYRAYFVLATKYTENIEININKEIQLNNPFELFDFKWSDHKITNLSWVKSDGNWVDGTVYESAYQKILEAYQEVQDGDGTSAPWITETINGIPVSYYPAKNGMKICTADQAAKVMNLYDTTGIAWYYIIDKNNKKFMLPRTKWGFVGERDNVETFVDESLPNITGNFSIPATYGDRALGTGVFIGTTLSGTTSSPNTGTKTGDLTLPFNANNSSPVYKDNASVQQKATEMLLYFYVGEVIQDANIIQVGELLDKVDQILSGQGGGSSSIPVETIKNKMSTFNLETNKVYTLKTDTANIGAPFFLVPPITVNEDIYNQIMVKIDWVDETYSGPIDLGAPSVVDQDSGNLILEVPGGYNIYYDYDPIKKKWLANYLKADGLEVVHIEGKETITGQKLISNDGQNSHVVNEGNSQLDIYCNNIDSSVVPTGSHEYGGISICDKNGYRIGKFEVRNSTLNNIFASISVSKFINGGYTYASIGALIDGNGKKQYQLGQASNGSSYYKIPTDTPGQFLLICFGAITGSATFPLAFTTTPQTVVSLVADGDAGYVTYVGTKSTTSIDIRRHGVASASAFGNYIAIGFRQE